MNVLLPKSVQINAWGDNGGVRGPAADAESVWGLRADGLVARSGKLLMPRPIPDENDWRHPEVGWGLVLADREDLPHAALAAGEDAPMPLRRLLEARGNAPVMRYRPELKGGWLRRYRSDGRPPSDLDAVASDWGTGECCIPRYLLIWGGPDVVPWRLQYALSGSRLTGRLWFGGDALERYVSALMSEWAGTKCDPLAPVVWSVDHGAGDITRLMQESVADPLWQSFDADGDFGLASRLRGKRATNQALAEHLRERHPGLVVTTSHGCTAPLNEPTILRERLGLPVDAAHAPLDSRALPADSLPGGAIWYAHACCSAGSDSAARCSGLFPAGNPVGDLLRGLSSAAGDTVAPLPTRLLEADPPARAFIGHVEPTFDWTLRDPITGQLLASALPYALYRRLYRRHTVGLALAKCFAEALGNIALHLEALEGYDRNLPGSAALANYRKLAGLDRQSMVLLGDPTVRLGP